MVEYGSITDINGAAGLVRVLLQDSQNITEWIPFLRPFAQGNSVSIPATINETVVVGYTANGLRYVQGAIASNVDKPYSGASADKFGVSFVNGTLFEHDIAANVTIIKTTGAINIQAAGKISIESDAEVEITALKLSVTAPEITLTGAVEVVGALTASGGLSVSGGDVSIEGGDIKADSISLKDHIHTGVTSGMGVSGKPSIL
jgi:phage baseplate assembly protein V